MFAYIFFVFWDCSGCYGHAAISPALYSRLATRCPKKLRLHRCHQHDAYKLLLLQIVVSYKSFPRYKTRLIDGLNCHIVSQATSLLGTGETLEQGGMSGAGQGAGQQIL